MDIESKTILALEASTELASVSVWHHGEIHSLTSDSPRSHAQALLPMMETILCEQGIELADLDLVLVSLGPGAFTGIRIGISVAQGLAYGAKLPLAGFNTLDILCKSLSERHDVGDGALLIPALDARMNEVYWAATEITAEGLVAVQAPCVTATVALEEFVGASKNTQLIGGGHGWAVTEPGAAPVDAHASLQPSAETMIRALSDPRFASRMVAPASGSQLEPLYLRNEVAWDKRVRIRAGQ